MAKIRALLLMGAPEYHNKPFHYAELAGILVGEAGADVRITDDLGVLHADALAPYDVILNWSTFVKPSAVQVDALLRAVEGGKGYVGLHGASATFWNSAAYLGMLGSRFIRHDPYKQFTVNVVDNTHPITAGVEDFAVEDELYEIGGDTAAFPAFAEAVVQGRPNSELREMGAGPLQPDVHLLAAAEGHPLLYVKSFGRGRVHYNALGHDTKALTHPSYRQLLRQALAWCSEPNSASGGH